MLRVHVNIFRYSTGTSAHAHILQSYNVVCFIFPDELDNDQIPNFQYEIVDDTQLGKYPHDHNVVRMVQT